MQQLGDALTRKQCVCTGHDVWASTGACHAQTAIADGDACDQAFAMQPGSPRFPCIHSMHGVGCRLPVNELLTVGTLSPVVDVYHIHTYTHVHVYVNIYTYIYIYRHVEGPVCMQHTQSYGLQQTATDGNRRRCDAAGDAEACTRPPKQPFVFVSRSDLPDWTKRLYQPAFGFCPEVLPLLCSLGSLRIDSSCG